MVMSFESIENKSASKKTEKHLNSLMENILDAIEDGICVIDRDMNILKTNKKMQDLYAHQVPLEGKKCYQAFHGSGKPCEDCPAIRAFSSHKTEISEVPLRQATGVTGVLEVHAFPVRGDSGRVSSMVEYVRDITQQKRVEFELAESGRQWQSTFNAINSVIWILDSENRIIHSNIKAESVFGLPSQNIVGKHCWQIVHGTRAPIPGCPLCVSKKTGKRETAEFKIGQTWYEATVDPIFTKGRYEKAVHILTEISDRKTAERFLKNSEQLYRSMFKKNMSAMLLIDPKTAKIVDANPAACTFYQYSRRVITTLKISDINMLSPDEIKKEMDKAKIQHRSYFVFQHRTASGIVKDVEVYSGPVQVGSKPLLCSIVHDISERKSFEKERERLIVKLQTALTEIKTLGGLLPICASCKKIRDDKGYWKQIESYIQAHSEARFSHGICPECSDRLYGDKDWYMDMKQKKDPT